MMLLVGIRIVPMVLLLIMVTTIKIHFTDSNDEIMVLSTITCDGDNTTYDDDKHV